MRSRWRSDRPRRYAGGLALALLLCLPAARANALSNEALMDTLQVTAFRFFWEQANPANGLVKDRSTVASPASIAATGFGLSAICTAIDHGWVSREAGRARVYATLNTFWTGPQGTGTTGYIGYKGLFYHFLGPATAKRTWGCEVSTIDTALLMAGILDCREYFNTADTLDVVVRALADSIYYRADWNFFRNSNPGILMGWKPETGFTGYGQWIGYNEAMILYILALGSPTHPVPATAWNTWTSSYRWQTHYGYTYVNFPPLFGHQYSHCWIDFRSIKDAYMRSQGITYFENSQRATMAQRAYCTANPGGFTGYGADLWGLTASDGPEGYNARGAPPAQNDNGTITPTAVGGSVPFAPTEALACLQTMWDNHRTQLWGVYGFKDAFNLTQNWWGTDYLGIDEGPIILMIENYRTGAPWSRFMQNADVQVGLDRAGFLVDSAGTDGPVASNAPALLTASPNPFRESTAIRFRVPSPGVVRLLLHDVTGRQVAQLSDGIRPAGEYSVTLDGAGLASGVYYYTLILRNQTIRKQCVLVR